MRDESGGDDKILCVPAKDPRVAGIQTLEDVSEFDRLETQHFFETYKDLEPGKSVKGAHWADPVSYTHLDVYKRQVHCPCPSDSSHRLRHPSTTIP